MLCSHRLMFLIEVDETTTHRAQNRCAIEANLKGLETSDFSLRSLDFLTLLFSFFFLDLLRRLLDGFAGWGSLRVFLFGRWSSFTALGLRIDSCTSSIFVQLLLADLLLKLLVAASFR